MVSCGIWSDGEDINGDEGEDFDVENVFTEFDGMVFVADIDLFVGSTNNERKDEVDKDGGGPADEMVRNIDDESFSFPSSTRCR